MTLNALYFATHITGLCITPTHLDTLVTERQLSALGTINTVAGTGAMGYSGDGGPATSATLNYPYGVAVDTSGNLYVSDTYNHVIRMVTKSTGIITTV